MAAAWTITITPPGIIALRLYADRQRGGSQRGGWRRRMRVWIFFFHLSFASRCSDSSHGNRLVLRINWIN